MTTLKCLFSYFLITVSMTTYASSQDLGGFEGLDKYGERCSLTVSYQGGDFVSAEVQFSDYNLTVSNLLLKDLEKEVTKTYWEDFDGSINQGQALFPGYAADISLKLSMNKNWEKDGFAIDFERQGWLSKSEFKSLCK